MLSIKAANIYDVIKPIHVCSQLLGLTLFSIKKVGENYKVAATFYHVLCIIIISFGIIVTVTWYNCFANVWNFNQDYMSKYFKDSSRLVLSCYLIMMMIVNWWLFLIKDKLMKLLALINDVDQSLMLMESSVNYKRHKKLLLAALIFMQTSIVLRTWLTLLMANATGFYRVSMFMMTVDFLSLESFSLLSLQFVCFIWTVKIRYQHINEILEKFYFNKASNIKVSLKLKPENLRKLSTLHNKLLDIASLISLCYGAPVSRNILRRIDHKFIL